MKLTRTLARPVEWVGVGLHTGEETSVRVVPADAGGYRLLDKQEEVSLRDCGLQGDGRGSVLILPSGRRVHTVEHLLAALRGMGVDDALIEVEGPEMPILDGSSLPFAREIRDAGIEARPGMPRVLNVSSLIGVDVPEHGRCGFVFPAEEFRLEYVVDYPGTPIGTQLLNLVLTPEVFLREIAPARTFCLESEVALLKQRSLARGGSLENAVVVGKEGPLNKEGLRFPDEYVRHKMLDLIGDLALLDCALTGHFVVVRAGHHLHQALVHRLRRFVPQGR